MRAGGTVMAEAKNIGGVVITQRRRLHQSDARTKRTAAILEIVRKRTHITQKELKDALAARGVVCAQSTIRRDVHDLHLCKQQTGTYSTFWVTLK